MNIAILKQRAKILQQIRDFFVARGYFEVETPIMARFGVSDIYLENMEVCWRKQTYKLQTSPEYHMKRLLAAGSGDIFQISKVFRDDELGRWHNPEFTMLEWYKTAADHHILMQEVADLLAIFLPEQVVLKLTYQEIFREFAGIDPFSASTEELQHKLGDYKLADVLEVGKDPHDEFLFLLLSHVIEPNLAALKQPLIIYDYPPSQAALAKVNDGRAQRFELYYRGVELANGYNELLDAEMLKARFLHDNAERLKMGKKFAPADEYLLAAMQQGLPPCSGVALGIDRLVALMCEQDSLSEVLSFAINIA
jgi:elongation factor P--(R)-beta-lysine ligase